MVGFGTADVPPSAAVKYVAAGSAACITDLLTCLLTGCTMGAMAVAFAQPTDVVKVCTAPNIVPYATVNCTEKVTYDIIDDTLFKSTPPTDNLPCHFVSAFGAGLCTTVIASPVDVIKMRYMNSALGQYSSVLNCAAAMMTNEGPLAFYKGFIPSFLSLGSRNVVRFVTYEQLKRAMMAANHNYTTIL